MRLSQCSHPHRKADLGVCGVLNVMIIIGLAGQPAMVFTVDITESDWTGSFLSAAC